MPKWYQRSNPDMVTPRPWLSPDAVEFLESLLQSDFRVIEHGSGGSTLWFAERVKQVVAYELNVNWFSVMDSKRPDNVEMRNASRPPRSGSFDLLLIDGEPVNERGTWIKKAAQLIRDGGYIVLDNANRPEYELERAELLDNVRLIKTVNANEAGTKYLVTEFYQL